MKCVICKHGETEPGRATLSFQEGDTTVIVKEVPADICRTCGEPYVSADVAAALDRRVDEAAQRGAEVEILRYAA
jgi:YgiT-type zinc finger domain-containing protein